MPEAKTIFKPVENSDYKSSHLDNLDRKYPSDKNKDLKMPDIRHIISINDHSINKCIISH